MTKSRTFTVALIVVLILLAVAAWLMFGRTAAGMSYPDADKYSVGSTTVTGPVNNLFVDWTSGQVNIEYHDGTGVIVSETANRELSEDDKMVVHRARRIERFLSQPFLVAEAFTGKKGQITPLADTIRSFNEICDGKWDHLPEQAFMYVGGIEQAAEQAEKMAAAAK